MSVTKSTSEVQKPFLNALLRLFLSDGLNQHLRHFLIGSLRLSCLKGWRFFKPKYFCPFQFAHSAIQSILPEWLLKPHHDGEVIS